MKEWLQRLHEGADWADILPGQRTRLQRLAARTLGLATLSNATTLLGAGLVLAGLSLFVHDHLLWGGALVLIGRLFDILDGYLARKTRTASPFGEGLDAGFDKLLMIICSIVLAVSDVVPWLVVILIGLGQIATTAVIVMARRSNVWLHPTRIGKYTTTGIWVTILAYLTGYWLADEGQVELGMYARTAATIVALPVIIMGTGSVVQYAKMARQKARAIDPLHQ